MKTVYQLLMHYECIETFVMFPFFCLDLVAFVGWKEKEHGGSNLWQQGLHISPHSQRQTTSCCCQVSVRSTSLLGYIPCCCCYILGVDCIAAYTKAVVYDRCRLYTVCSARRQHILRLLQHVRKSLLKASYRIIRALLGERNVGQVSSQRRVVICRVSEPQVQALHSRTQ